jgi:nucleotide-binding universal stress UspA family protein
MEWRPQAIVAAVDGSEASIRAAQTAASLAKAQRARLVLVTAVRLPEGWWGVTGEPPTPEAVSHALTAAQRRILEDTIAVLQLDGIEHAALAEMGDPTSVILDVCRQEQAGLLVIGRRGAGLVERMLIGSVADRLAHHSPCPVLIVP